jgi:hypothetical protein
MAAPGWKAVLVGRVGYVGRGPKTDAHSSCSTVDYGLKAVILPPIDSPCRPTLPMMMLSRSHSAVLESGARSRRGRCSCCGGHCGKVQQKVTIELAHGRSGGQSVVGVFPSV